MCVGLAIHHVNKTTTTTEKKNPRYRNVDTSFRNSSLETAAKDGGRNAAYDEQG